MAKPATEISVIRRLPSRSPKWPKTIEPIGRPISEIANTTAKIVALTAGLRSAGMK